MLGLTTNAVTAIRKLTDRSERPDTAGLRITKGGSGTLKLSICSLPAEDDSILDDGGARVFLDQQVAQILDEMTLDAGTDAAGRVRFGLGERGE